MAYPKWQDILIPPSDPASCWELFHENSKVSRFDKYQDIDVIRKEMRNLHESLPYDGYPKVELPQQIPSLDVALGDAICARRSVRRLEPVPLDLETVTTILYYSYGLTGETKEIPRCFRAVPSGGALYPLELYFYSASLPGLEPGFYHYNPCEHQLTFLQGLETPNPICHAVRQPDLIDGASMVLFITALFERTVFKYGDRGYRFVLMEVGHLAQNVHLVTQGVGLAGVSIGGFFDREMDRLLRLDGLNHSTLCLIAIGKNSEGNDARDSHLRKEPQGGSYE
ncbi:MAG: SagB/ThcOx family dehydrogenase [Nitrospiraceae bacterium]